METKVKYNIYAGLKNKSKYIGTVFDNNKEALFTAEILARRDYFNAEEDPDSKCSSWVDCMNQVAGTSEEWEECEDFDDGWYDIADDLYEKYIQENIEFYVIETAKDTISEEKIYYLDGDCNDIGKTESTGN